MTELHKNSKDLTGLRFGKLVVLSWSGRRKHGGLTWLCKSNNGTGRISSLD